MEKLRWTQESEQAKCSLHFSMFFTVNVLSVCLQFLLWWTVTINCKLYCILLFLSRHFFFYNNRVETPRIMVNYRDVYMEHMDQRYQKQFLSLIVHSFLYGLEVEFLLFWRFRFFKLNFVFLHTAGTISITKHVHFIWSIIK